MKLGIVSQSFVESDMGQSIVLLKLLQSFNPKEYFLIASHFFSIFRENNSLTLQGRKFYPFSFPHRIEKWLLKLHLEHYYLEYRVRQFTRLMKKEGCTAVVGCTADLFGSYGAYTASSRLGLPFILYSFDDYSDQWSFDPTYLKFALEIEHQVIMGSTQVIVPNEFLREEYLKRFGIDSTLIHNPVDVSLFDSNIPQLHNKRIKIIYTGSIYAVHYDSFQALVNAINNMEKVELHIYTNQAFDSLKQNGISGPCVEYHKSVPYDQIPALLASADILLLPLAFHSPYPDSTIKTASPGKMGEYIASGRPVLVIAPQEAYISWYFKTNNCGVVVNDLFPDRIAMGIQEAIKNTDKFKDNKEIARRDFDIHSQQLKFRQLFG